MTSNGSHTILSKDRTIPSHSFGSSTMATPHGSASSVSSSASASCSSTTTTATTREQLLLVGETIVMMEDPLRRRLLDHKERMEVMFWQEVAHYRTTDYLALPDTLPVLSCGGDREAVMSEQWRTRMCEWAYQCKSMQQ
jgi:hypothetical protein